MVKQNRKKKQDADLDLEMDEYNPSESDDDYDDNEKLMLKQAAKRRLRQTDDDDDESEEEVLGVHESDDEDDEEEEVEMGEPLGDEMDSDIEGKNDDDDLPDSKAWGSKKNSYYNTDYVDQDYGGFSKAEEEEAALLEEQEARAIQNRQIAELDEADVSLRLVQPKDSEKKRSGFEGDDFSEVIKTDISKLSKREKMAMLVKESPEFLGLISDFKERMTYAKDCLEPILDLVKLGEVPNCPAVKFVSTKYHLTLNYCTNIAFYVLLKSKRVRVTNHPIIKRLLQFRKLLEEMDPIDEEVIQPQVQEILKLKEKGKQLKIIKEPELPAPIITGNRAERRRKLQLLKEEEEMRSFKKPKIVSFEDIQQNENESESGGEEEPEEDTTKRGITFEIAKNKGLTPKRKKEDRNPRVKLRNKFRKATVRRKGQVRGVYKEVKKYDGEPFGIKASVSKSIKLK